MRLKWLAFTGKKHKGRLDKTIKVQYTVLNDVDHLCEVADKSMFTIDCEGHLSFNLYAWIHIRTVIEKLQTLAKNVEQKTVALLTALEKKRNEELLNTVLASAYQASTKKWYYEERKTINLDSFLNQCCQLMSVFCYPDSAPLFSAMEGKPVFKHAKASTLNMLQRLTNLEQKLTFKWNEFDEHIKSAIEVQNFEKKVKMSTERMNSLEVKLVGGQQANRMGSVTAKYKFPKELYKELLFAKVEGCNIVNEVNTLNRSDLAKRLSLSSNNTEFELKENRSFVPSTKCKNDFFQLIEKCFKNAIFPSSLEEGDIIFSKMWKFYQESLKKINAEILCDDTRYKETLNGTLTEIKLNMSNLMSVHESLNSIGDCEVRCQARLLVYRCSVLLQGCTAGCLLTDENRKSITEWKSHMDGHKSFGKQYERLNMHAL